MTYDDDLRKCVRDACEKTGKSEFARRVGLDQSMVAKILSGRAPGCTEATWKRMRPLLIEHGGLDPRIVKYLTDEEHDEMKRVLIEAGESINARNRQLLDKFGAVSPDQQEAVENLLETFFQQTLKARRAQAKKQGL